MIPGPPATRAALPSPGARRGRAGFGGLVPGGAVARAGEALVTCLAVEHHADGAVLALVALSGAPGALTWDPAAGLEVRDDAGRPYAAAALAQHAGLGSLQASVWIAPAPPAAARCLRLRAEGLARIGAARGGRAIERPLSGGPWDLAVALAPPRTVAPPPPEPPVPATGAPARAPARAWGSFAGVEGIGQARLTADGAVCLWAIERYADRGVLTLAGLGRSAADAEGCRIAVWDGEGRRYGVGRLHLGAGEGWFELGLELTPAPPGEGTLAVRVDHLPGGPYLFGAALGGGA